MTQPAVSIIEPIAPSVSRIGAAELNPAPSASQFESWMTHELQQVNASMVKAEQGIRDLSSGAPVNVHEVMLQMEQARLQFQLALQVRNKVIEGYQEGLRMQV